MSRTAGEPNRVVQSLWIGERITAMERASMQSFLANGHEYDLYCYGDVAGVPRGVRLKDGNSILPADRIFGYADGFAKGSPAAFSNFFRYKLLLERGGWWVDTDVICLKRFDLGAERILASEEADPPRGTVVSTCVIKAAAGDELMAWAWGKCEAMDTSRIVFGQIGPNLLDAGVNEFGLHAFVVPPSTFSPIPFFAWRSFVDVPSMIEPGEESLAVHLWNQMWSADGTDKDAAFPNGCFYETIKERFAHA